MNKKLYLLEGAKDVQIGTFRGEPICVTDDNERFFLVTMKDIEENKDILKYCQWEKKLPGNKIGALIIKKNLQRALDSLEAQGVTIDQDNIKLLAYLI